MRDNFRAEAGLADFHIGSSRAGGQFGSRVASIRVLLHGPAGIGTGTAGTGTGTAGSGTGNGNEKIGEKTAEG